jgi:F-type H+-transporting ATPase subunit delta
MVDHKVAKRYANALYAEAVKNDVVTAVEADLTAISGLIHDRGEFHDFLLTPYVAREEKVKIADRLFSDRVTALTMYFLRLLLEKRREAEFDTIREEYVTLRRDHSNVLYVEVVSALPLEDKHRTAIEKKLVEKTGKKIEAVYDVEPSLIGGLKVVYGNYVLDGTAKGSLVRLKDSLRHDLLKQF